MKPLLIFLGALLLAGPVRAGNVTTYPTVSTVQGGDLFFDWQAAAQQNCTATQLKAYVTGGGSLSIATGKTFSASNTLTLTGTDGATIAFGAGGTVLYASGLGSSVQPYSATLAAIAANSGALDLSGLTLTLPAGAAQVNLTGGTGALDLSGFTLNLPAGTAQASLTGGTGLLDLSGYTVTLPAAVTALFEPALGDPAADGDVLSSTAAGVRSWVAPGGGSGLTIGTNAGGYPYLAITSGVLDFSAPVNGSGGVLTFEGLGHVTEAWSANLDAVGAVTFDAGVIAAAQNAVNSANGLAALDGGSNLNVAGSVTANDLHTSYGVYGPGGQIMDAGGDVAGSSAYTGSSFTGFFSGYTVNGANGDFLQSNGDGSGLDLSGNTSTAAGFTAGLAQGPAGGMAAGDFITVDGSNHFADAGYAAGSFAPAPLSTGNGNSAASVSGIVTYTPGTSEETLRVGGFLTTRAVAGDTVQMQVTYTDETATARTLNLSAVVSSTGVAFISPVDIRAQGGYAVSINTVVSGAGTISYDYGASIQHLY